MIHSLNENIRELRQSIGISQVDLANALHVSKQCVSNWENDNVQPSVEMLVKLADYFRVSTDQLLGRSDKPVINAAGLTAEQAAHIRLLIKDLVAANE